MPIICVLIAIASIQSGASIAKELFPITGIAGTVTLRLLFASLMVSLLWKPWRAKISREHILPLLGYGASLGLMNLTFYLSLARIPLGIAVAIEFLGPLGIALFYSRKLLDVFWAFLAGLGIYLLVPTGASQAESLDPLGVGLSVIAGAIWAAYILCGQKIGRAIPGGMVVCLGMIIASVFVVPVGIAMDGDKILNLSALPYALGVAFLSSALPYSLEMIGLRQIPAKTFSILMSLEPAVAALSGFIFLQERLTLTQCGAMGCIMLASVGSAWLAKSSQH